MSIISDLQAIGKVLQQAGNIKLYQELLKIQGEAVELMDKYRSIKEENSLLKEKLKIKNTIVLEDDVYWIKDNKGKITDGPICPSCYDEKDIIMHLIKPHPYPGKHCPRCGLLREDL